MSDRYYFPGQFSCMYCKEDLDTEGGLSLANGGQIDLKCPKCNAVWKFWVKVQLNHRLTQGGKFNQTKKPSDG